MAKKIIACIIISFALLNLLNFNLDYIALHTIAAETSEDAAPSPPVPAAVFITYAWIDTTGSVSAGNTFKGEVTVTNKSASRVENVSVESSTSNARIGIESFLSQTIGALEPGQSQTAEFTYKVAAGVDRGETQIEFVAYANGVKQDSTVKTVNVLGEAPKATAYFEILAAISPSTISTDTADFKIGIRFAVRGTGINNVKVAWSASDAFEPKSPQTKSYGFMQVNYNEYFEFEISPSNKITPGSHTITVSITGVYGDNTAKYDYEVGIFVEKGEGEYGQGIKIISTEIPESAKTGEKFQIKSVLQNAGAAVKNITVTLKNPAGIANNSLSVLKIPSLERGEDREITFDLFVTGDAIENYNLFELTIAYDDISNTHYTGLNIILDKSQDVKIISTNIPESVKKGEKFQIKAVVANEGSNEVKNISVTLKSPAGIVNSSSNIVQIGSLERGGKRDISFDLLASDGAVDNYNLFELVIEYSGITKSQYVGLNIIWDGRPGDYTITTNLTAGVRYNTDFKLAFTVKNNGGDAKNLIFSVPNPDGIVNKTVNSFLVPSLKSGESITKEITFSAKEEAAGKYCLFEITVSGKDAEGKDNIHAKQYTGTAVNNIDEKSEGQPELSVDYITIPNATGINSDFNVEIRLTNKGAEAKNVILTLEPQQGLINKTSNVIKIDNIAPYGSGVGRFTFMATDSASNGFNAINIKVEYSYKKADGTIANGDPIAQYSGLIVVNPKKDDQSGDGDTKKEMPVVIISRFDYGGEEVYGGKSFNFELDLLNTHRSIAVKDLKITLSQEKGIFTPKSGSNTFFAEQLSPGGTIGQKIELIVKTDALPDSYGLTVSLEYKNENGDATTATEIINIPVQQETRFHIGEIPMINEVALGDEAYLNIQFGNLGKSTIYNVNVKVESDSFYDPDGGYFAGNLEAGKSANKAFYLTPTMPGMAMGKIVFVYENAIGEQFSDEVEVSFMVMGGDGDMSMDNMGEHFGDAEPMGEGGEIIGFDEEGQPIFAMNGEIEEENKGFFKWLFTDMGILQWVIIIGTGLIVIAVIVIIIAVSKRRKNKFEADEDDL